jgi:hypothetical protein
VGWNVSAQEDSHWQPDLSFLGYDQRPGKDRSPNGLGDKFQDLWFDDLVHAQAIRALFLLESNAGFDRFLLLSSPPDGELMKGSSSPLTRLLERGLFEPEQGEGQMWGQRNSKYAAAIGVQLLAKIHCLESQLRDVGRLQNHPVDKLLEQTDFVGDAID